MAITPLPAPPLPSDSTLEFNTKAFAWVASIDNWTDEVNAITPDIAAVAAIDAQVVTVAGIAANVTTVAGISANVTTVANSDADIGAVADNLSGADTIGTVAGVATEVAALGPIAADITAVAAVDTDVTVVAGITADVGTVSGIAADVTTVAGISTDVTAVVADATNIGIVASNVVDVNTVAGISADVTTVAGIDTNVTTVAGISADVTAVANDEVDIGLVADSIANVNTTATNIASVNTVATNIADVNTVADALAVPLSAANAVSYDNTASGLSATNVQTAVDELSAEKANIDSPTFTGTPTAPTAAAATNTTQVATTAHVFAERTNTATLTNKTLTSPAISNPSVTGDLSIADKIVHTGDTNTAIRFPADDTVTVETGGVERVRVNSSGDVTIFGVLTVGGNAVVPSSGLFAKADTSTVAWSKTGAFTVSTATALYIEVDGSIKTIASATAVTMPAATSGTDYAIWCKPDGTLEATDNHTSPPVANSRKVGGFHYAPGGNATGTSGGDTTPAINEYSFYDLKWRPACPDPRGMTLVAGGYWVDIYLTGVDAITNGSSKFNVTIADGSSPPKVPTMFGGNGSTTYGSFTWFEANELATAFGKRTMTQLEYMSAAYGTTEASSRGSDPVTTQMSATDDNFTSKWGLIQASGVLFIWGRDRGGPFAGASYNANTEGRGSEYNAPNCARFGGLWGNGANSGSRDSNWYNAASNSSGSIGSRFACDHLQLD